MLLSAIGVLLLFVGEAAITLLIGILVLTFTGTLATGVILVWVFVRRERNLSELQADFVSKVSHELRTPLTSIRMFAETLKLRRGDAATEERCIEALDRESTRLQVLIDRLLDWGRMESGMRTYELSKYDVHTVVEEAIQAFEPTRTGRDVECSTVLEEPLPDLVCDRAAVVDVLVNLLSNAYKYGGSPRKITISAGSTATHLKIVVRDNGIGIPRGEHKRIFLKFYRVDDKLTRIREGSGLGLAIVQHVMRAHRGKVEVESTQGAGSAFSLLFPLKRPMGDMLFSEPERTAKAEPQ